MRSHIRSRVPGGTYFFTVALQERGSRWLVDHIELLRESLTHVKARYPFAIQAMVVLPDHLHAVWTLPFGDANYPLRWMILKRRFTRALLCRRLLDARASRKRGDAERSLWQSRYREHLIRDDEDLARHVDYIHFNPVKHGFVLRAADWPHSTFHRYVERGMLPADWGSALRAEGGLGE